LCSRGPGSAVGAAPSRWELVAGELAIDGHRGAVTERGEGVEERTSASGLARLAGSGRGRQAGREREEHGRRWAPKHARVWLGRARGGEGSRPRLKIFVFLFFSKNAK
jgi:hypothetical protein